MKKYTFTVEFSDEGFEKFRQALVEKNGEDSEEYSRGHLVYNELFLQLHSFLQENNGTGYLRCDEVTEDSTSSHCVDDQF